MFTAKRSYPKAGWARMIAEGVLETVSGGSVISSEGTGVIYTENLGIGRARKTGVDSHAGWTRREFIDIGGQRVRNVMLRPYHDELLMEAIGERIALSFNTDELGSEKRHSIVAMRTPKGGLSKPTTAQLWFASFVWTFRFWVSAGCLFVLLLIPAFLVMLIWGPLLFVGIVAAIAVAAWWSMKPFKLARKMFRAAAALDNWMG